MFKAALSKNAKQELVAGVAQMTGTYQGYRAMIRGLLAKSDAPKNLTARMTDIPLLSKSASKRLGSVVKEDMSAKGGSAFIDFLHKAPYVGKALTGNWTYDLMQIVDTGLKTPFSIGILKRDLIKIVLLPQV